MIELSYADKVAGIVIGSQIRMRQEVGIREYIQKSLCLTMDEYKSKEANYQCSGSCIGHGRGSPVFDSEEAPCVGAERRYAHDTIKP